MVVIRWQYTHESLSSDPRAARKYQQQLQKIPVSPIPPSDSCPKPTYRLRRHVLTKRRASTLNIVSSQRVQRISYKPRFFLPTPASQFPNPSFDAFIVYDLANGDCHPRSFLQTPASKRSIPSPHVMSGQDPDNDIPHTHTSFLQKCNRGSSQHMQKT